MEKKYNDKTILILQKKKGEYDLKKNFIELNCVIEEFNNIDDFFSYDLSAIKNKDLKNFLILFDGKTFIEWEKKRKQEFIEMYSGANIVLMGDFSESYLFSKALLEKSCREFIVTPFGKREAKGLFSRLFTRNS